ncbi:MAG: type IV pilus assembly protein PilB [Flavobacterium sp.]|jgi:type IV pilus assembly protein PilB
MQLYTLSKDGLFPYITLMNQRLGRRLCTICSESATLSTEDVDMIETIMHFNQKQDRELSHKSFKIAVGCEECINGYKGRVGAYEVLEVGEQRLDALAQNAELDKLWSIAIDNGTETIGYNLLMKAANGETSLNEVRRVTEQF